ncbi:MAG: dihydrofolate reductase [Candidatus Neomarinimicrobiota bacterium]
MEVILIAAVTANGRIARHDRDPVDWSRDRALFREQTMGCPVIVGSTTFRALKTDLPGRTVIVVSRNDQPEKILAALRTQRCFVIGGSRTFGGFAPFLTGLYLTFHPRVFCDGLPLFWTLPTELKLVLEGKIGVPGSDNIHQFQYRLLKQ